MVGQTIGSYSILRQLGAGAMGEVYLAEHRHLKRKAALKLLAPGLVGRPDLLERFFLEARATSAIAHAGIVQIFDCELDATGRPYIVMEYLEGDTLAATLARRGPLPPPAAARVARAIAEALDAAHAKGIVHRDLKPENVFVAGEPPDSVKLVDFGIAKLAGDIRAAQVHQTRTGAMMGTPLYMSPEQCRDSAKLDERTDVYSLGCVTFEMLTGRPPFTQDALGELIVAHMTTPPPDVRALNGTVPLFLSELTGELLKKDPAERPTMRQVADRLAAFLGRLTTVPGPQPEALAAAPTLAADAPARLSQASPAAAPRPSQEATRPAASATTLGDTASELNATEARPARGKLVVLGVAAAAVLAGAGVMVFRAGASSTGGPAAPAATGAKVAAASAAVVPALPQQTPPASAPPASAAAPPASAPEQRERKLPAAARRSGARKTIEAQPEANLPSAAPAAVASSPATPAAAAPAPRTVEPSSPAGGWEGPWVDPVKQQKGRLMLQIGADGHVAGWMTNAAAKQSYRMVGRLQPGGYLDLACQCPRQQAFWARGAIRVAGGELTGQLSLLGSSGVFGQSQLSLRHAPTR